MRVSTSGFGGPSTVRVSPGLGHVRRAACSFDQFPVRQGLPLKRPLMGADSFPNLGVLRIARLKLLPRVKGAAPACNHLSVAVADTFP